MKLLTDWGFTRAGWQQGDRGEYWVVAQAVLLLIFILLPIQRIPLKGVPFPLMSALLIFALTLGLFAILFLIKGLLDLGNSLTPLPYPRAEGELVQSGVYAIVRHPIYAAVIMGVFAYAIYQLSIWHSLSAIGLFWFFNAKADREEIWLTEKYTDYSMYKQQVKKLIPWVY